MIKEKQNKKHECCQNDVLTRGKECSNCNCHNNSSALYGLGVIGALFYFLKDAATFSAVILGIGKSFFWPAFIVFKVLTNLHV